MSEPSGLFGPGGVFVEVLENTTLRVTPVSGREAAGMIDEAGVVETVRRLSPLVAGFPAVVELDVNPSAAMPGGVVAIDARLTVDPEKL